MMARLNPLAPRNPPTRRVHPQAQAGMQWQASGRSVARATERGARGAIKISQQDWCPGVWCADPSPQPAARKTQVPICDKYCHGSLRQPCVDGTDNYTCGVNNSGGGIGAKGGGCWAEPTITRVPAVSGPPSSRHRRRMEALCLCEVCTDLGPSSGREQAVVS